jgi:hypothetical protein
MYFAIAAGAPAQNSSLAREKALLYTNSRLLTYTKLGFSHRNMIVLRLHMTALMTMKTRIGKHFD